MAIIRKTTFIDDAELVWKLTESFTQEQAAKAMGWGVSAVKKYSALSSICKDAWEIIKVPTFKQVGTDDDDDDGNLKVPTGNFSERILREVLDLDPGQQVALCGYLAKEDHHL